MDNLNPAERDFCERLRALERDAVKAATFVYTLGAFDHLAGSDQDLRDKVNEHAGFWLTVLAALQAAGFVALGRLYDDDGRSHHMRGLLDFAESVPGIFSRPFLEARKVARGLDPADARQYAAQAAVPGKAEFDQVRAEFNNCDAIYRRGVRDIRNQVFAHAGRITRDDLQAMLNGLPMREFERVAVFSLQLWDALWNTYENGVPLALRPAPSNVAEMVRDGLPPNTTTWEHVHAADAAVRFLRTLR